MILCLRGDGPTSRFSLIGFLAFLSVPRVLAMSDDDEITLDNLRGALEPLRRCGQRAAGSLHGVPFVDHLERITRDARKVLPLKASEQREADASLIRFKTFFHKLTNDLHPSQCNDVARTITEAAFFLSFGTPRSLTALRSAMGRYAAIEKGSPMRDAVNGAFAELGPKATARAVRNLVAKKGFTKSPSDAQISRYRPTKKI